MKVTQRVLGIIALIVLMTQTARHAYLLWLEPRTSVLDPYDRPHHDQVSNAESLDELVELYDPIRKEADRIDKASGTPDDLNVEPFLSKYELETAITDWENRTRQIHALWFYWFVGLLVCLLGVTIFRWCNVWYGLALEITAFAEFIYWTSPTFLGSNVKEFDRLLSRKLLLSAISLVLLVAILNLQRVFAADSYPSDDAA